MRAVPIISGNYYHVYNRGSLKQVLFHDKADYARFLFLVLYLQSPRVVLQTNRYINNYLEKRVFGVKEKEDNEICLSRFVEVINFCIMPNHFHITVKSTTEEGISRYMHRVANAYAKYFNKKYSKSGHVFQGTYKAKFISSDSQLVYLSAYVHRNPHDLEMWKNNSINYPWSSYQDYERNRWGRLLLPAEITESFRNHGDYRDYVESSGAKDKWEDEYGGTVDFI